MKLFKRMIGFTVSVSLMIMSLPALFVQAEDTQLVNYATGCEIRSCVSGEKTPVKNVLDGDETTDWSTYSSTRAGCMEITLPNSTLINKVTVLNGSSVGRNITLSIETSPDGYDWYTRRKDVRVESKQSIDIFFEETICEYVKINVTDVEIVSGKYYGFSIAEVGIYYDTNCDKTKLKQAIQSTENLIEKFKSMNPDEVTVPEEAYQILSGVIDDANAVINRGSSQYVVDNETAKVYEAQETFIGMVKYSDSVFDFILEGQKNRQLDVNESFSSSNDIWTSMNKEPDADMLWPHTWETANAESAFLVNWGDNFYKMARSYLCDSPNKGNKQLLADIEYGLNWLCDNKYNESTEQYGNWWHWSIGGPKRYIYTLIALKDDLSEETIEKVTRVMRFWLGDFWNKSGANRTDPANIAIGVAAFMKDGAYLYKAQQCILEDLVYQEDGGTGHFKDGSYLYHQGLAYNGNYGKEQLNSVSSILMMTAGTPFQVDDYYINALREISENGYDPLVYKGHFTYAARGRQIYGVNRANDVSNILNNVGNCLQDPGKTLVKSLSLKMGLANSTDDVIADSNWTMHKRYTGMDRTAHLNDDFGFYLSTYSPRTKLFEATNGENMLGWYLSAGTFFLETEDNTYFDDGYMETIDWYRLPGITVDSVTRTNKRWGGESYNQYEFVGGAKIGNYGIEAMEFGLPYTDLHGKKSWFMFDDEIVFLGSDISETSGYKVETIIDNRKIKNTNDNKLVVDGEEKDNALGKVKQHIATTDPLDTGEDISRGEEISKGYSEKLLGVNWIYLEDNKKAGIGNGYIFPGKNTINVKREERIGCEAVTEFTGDQTEISRNWVTMWIDHGVNPEKASYEWILLPQKSQSEIEEYSSNPQIRVIENSSNVQAVYETNLNILGVNSYSEKGTTVEGITVNKPASYMLHETENYYEFSISEPVRSQTETIHVVAKLDVDKVLFNDAQIYNVNFGNGEVSFDVDVSDASGYDYRIILGKTGIFDGVESEGLDNTYLQIGNENAIAGRRTHKIIAPVIKDQLTYIPLRFVAEALGARVSWDGKTQRIQILTDSHVAMLKINSNVLKLDGEEITIDAVPININGTTMVPLRALSEALDAEVNWNPESQVVEIVPEGSKSYLDNMSGVFAKLK